MKKTVKKRKFSNSTYKPPLKKTKDIYKDYEVKHRSAPYQASDAETTNSSRNSHQYDIIISKDEPEHQIPPLSIYIGSGYGVEVKEFRKNYYVCFSHTINDDNQKRLNLPLSQIYNLQEAVNRLSEYVKKYKKF